MPTHREHQEQVAQHLEQAIEALGISQAEVARALDISLSKLGNWLRASHYPDVYLMTVFCDRYGVTMDFLYRGVVYGLPKEVADDLARSATASRGASPGAAAPAPKTRGRSTAKAKA